MRNRTVRWMTVAGAGLLLLGIAGISQARADRNSGYGRNSGHGSRGGISLNLSFGNGGYNSGRYGYGSGYRSDWDDRYDNDYRYDNRRNRGFARWDRREGRNDRRNRGGRHR